MCATAFPAWALEPANFMAGDPACPKCRGCGTLIRETFSGNGTLVGGVSCFVCGGDKLTLLAQRPDIAARNAIRVADYSRFLVAR